MANKEYKLFDREIKTTIRVPGYSGFKINAKATGESVTEESARNSGTDLYNAIRKSIDVGTYNELERNVVVNLLKNSLELKVMNEMKDSLDKNTSPDIYHIIKSINIRHYFAEAIEKTTKEKKKPYIQKMVNILKQI